MCSLLANRAFPLFLAAAEMVMNGAPFATNRFLLKGIGFCELQLSSSVA